VSDADADTGDGPVLLFDGVCNLCNGAVQFVIRHDPAERFRFAPLQSDAARRLCADCDAEATDLDTVVLVEGGECYVRSDAALRTARHLTFPYALLWAFRVVPRPVRDAVYDLVAEYRYDVFGRREECMVPSPALEERFLD
jgi:predicted DCC family thiol-disulfide oxidoreductase YuxK